MLSDHRLPWTLRYIHDDNIVSIDVDSLVTNHQLLKLISFRSHDIQFTIANIKLVLILSHELKVVSWICLAHSDDEETQLLVKLVCNQVKAAIFLVVNDLLNDSDVKSFVQIDFNFFLNIFVNTIFLWRNNHDVLLVIHLEELWLSQQWIIKFVNSVDRVFFIIYFDNSVLLHENQAGWVIAFGCVFEVKLHADFVHDRDFFDDNSLVQLEINTFNSFKNEKLICFLLFHDQILPTDNC